MRRAFCRWDDQPFTPTRREPAFCSRDCRERASRAQPWKRPPDSEGKGFDGLERPLPRVTRFPPLEVVEARPWVGKEPGPFAHELDQRTYDERNYQRKKVPFWISETVMVLL